MVKFRDDVLCRFSQREIMPILSRRSQSQYSRRQAGSGQSLNGEWKKRHTNVVHPAKSAVDNNVTRISAVYPKETSRSTLEHSRTQLHRCQSQDDHNMTSLPYAVNGSGSRTGSGSVCPVPMPLPSPPPLTYYCRPAVVRQRRIPAGDPAREREALKRQQRMQVVKTAVSCECSNCTSNSVISGKQLTKYLKFSHQYHRPSSS